MQRFLVFSIMEAIGIVERLSITPETKDIVMDFLLSALICQNETGINEAKRALFYAGKSPNDIDACIDDAVFYLEAYYASAIRNNIPEGYRVKTFTIVSLTVRVLLEKVRTQSALELLRLEIQAGLDNGDYYPEALRGL